MTSKRKYFNIKCKLYHMLEFEMKRSRNLFDEKTKVELLLSLTKYYNSLTVKPAAKRTA